MNYETKYRVYWGSDDDDPDVVRAAGPEEAFKLAANSWATDLDPGETIFVQDVDVGVRYRFQVTGLRLVREYQYDMERVS